MRTVLRGVWHQASIWCLKRCLQDTRRPPAVRSLTRTSGALFGRTFSSLAARGNHMDSKEDQSKPNLEATPEVALPINKMSPAQSELDSQHQMGTPRTLEVPKHPDDENSNMDEGVPITPEQLEREDELLKSPGTPKSTGTLDDATEQLSNLRMKRKNLTTAQRREALKAKLLERGEVFDPAKWRRGQKKKPRKSDTGKASGTNVGPNTESRAAKRPRGEMATPPSVEGPTKKARSGTQRSEKDQTPEKPSTSRQGVSYRDISAIKLAIVLEGFPEAKLSAEQGEAIEDAMMDEIQPLEDGTVPSFAGTYMEKGALITSCLNDATKHWLEQLIPRINPLGNENKLRVGLRKDILRSTRVFFRAHPKLLKKTPEKVLKMLDTQNPTLNVKEWRVLPAKPDPKGYGFVCFLDEVCFNAVKAANSRANLGLWQVSIVSTTVKDNAQNPTDQPPTQ